MPPPCNCSTVKELHTHTGGLASLPPSCRWPVRSKSAPAQPIQKKIAGVDGCGSRSRTASTWPLLAALKSGRACGFGAGAPYDRSKCWSGHSCLCSLRSFLEDDTHVCDWTRGRLPGTAGTWLRVSLNHVAGRTARTAGVCGRTPFCVRALVTVLTHATDPVSGLEVLVPMTRMNTCSCRHAADAVDIVPSRASHLW